MNLEHLLDTQLNHYHLESILGWGGMSVVYRARHTHGKVFALKVLMHGPAAESEVRSRFTREAETVSKLRHPGIVRVFDAGEDKGYVYMAMDLVEGETLAAMLGKQGKLPELTAIDIAWQIADALHYAHTQGVIHRDVKPSNIIITPNGQAHLTDFGIALALDAPALTQTGYTVGTPAYMAPEQAQGDKPDGRADIYALGVVLYHMVTGRPPFQGNTPQILYAQVFTPPAAPSSIANISTGLERIIMQALAKEPKDRLQTALLLAQALNQVEEDLDETPLATPIIASSDSQPSPEPRHRYGYGLAGLGVLLAIIFLLFQFILPSQSASNLNATITTTATPITTFTPEITSSLVHVTSLSTTLSTILPDPTETNTPESTVTSTVTPSPTPSPSPQPSATSSPSPTLAPSTATATSVPTETPTPIATPCPQPVADTFTTFAGWVTVNPGIGCPVTAPTSLAIAWQPFEHGFLLWRSDLNLIYILWPDGTWSAVGDRWRSGDLEFDSSLTPPNGLYQPVRGFGLVWRENEGVQENLGWALGEEQGLTITFQEFSNSFGGGAEAENLLFILFNNRTYRVN